MSIIDCMPVHYDISDFYEEKDYGDVIDSVIRSLADKSSFTSI